MNDLLTRTRPADARLADEWAPDPQLMAQLTAQPASAPHRLSRRTWLISGAAAAGLAIVGTVAGLPTTPVESAAAAPLRKAAAAAAKQTPLRWAEGQFLHVHQIIDQTGPLPPEEAGHQEWDSWYAPDGWHWSHRKMGDGTVMEYIFRPGTDWMNPNYAASMPTDPDELDWFLRARVQGASGADEAVFNAIDNMLALEAAPPALRAAALEVLARNPMVSVADATDPAGRAALAVTYGRGVPGGNTLYLAPETGDLLGRAYRTKSSGSGLVEHRSAITVREVVNQLPAPIVATLGTDKIQKEHTTHP